MVITLSFSLVLAGLLNAVRTESRVSRQNSLHLRAAYAAEATGQFAASQIRATLQTRSTISATQFTSAGTPPVMPDASILGTTRSSALADFGAGTAVSNVINTLPPPWAAPRPARPMPGALRSRRRALTSGAFSAERLQFIDPAKSALRRGSVRGQTVRVREIQLYSAARATDAMRSESAGRILRDNPPSAATCRCSVTRCSTIHARTRARCHDGNPRSDPR